MNGRRFMALSMLKDVSKFEQRTLEVRCGVNSGIWGTKLGEAAPVVQVAKDINRSEAAS